MSLIDASRKMTSTTSGGEKQRQTQQHQISQPGEGTQFTYGKIIQVNPENPLIKAVDLHSNSPISSGRWITLNHSVREIVERWGQLQTGWIVKVEYSGPDAANAIATIIKEQDENIAETTVLENSITVGSYKIFSPGLGLG